MMSRKLAGLFALLAMVGFFGSWMATRLLREEGQETAPLEDAWLMGAGVAVCFWLVGLFLAALAIGLMREVMAERRSRETEKRFRARTVYEAILDEEGPEGA